MLAPICLFTYSRMNETIQTIEALKKNNLATESQLFIFSDGPKNDKAVQSVNAVREYLKTVEGFKSVEILESIKNKGLAKSIISGVSSIIEQFGKIIVLEDDLVTSANFLDFMNQALDFYSNQSKIFSISGYTNALPSLNNSSKDFYYSYRACSTGWGTWGERWKHIDWEVKDYKNVIYNPKKRIDFMRGGSDMPHLLWKQMNGKIDSWAIRWCYYQYKNDMLTVFPTKSKLVNIGYGKADGTHTQEENRFKVEFDDGQKVKFSFSSDVTIDRKLIKEFRNEFSVWKRLKHKLTK